MSDVRPYIETEYGERDNRILTRIAYRNNLFKEIFGGYDKHYYLCAQKVK